MAENTTPQAAQSLDTSEHLFHLADRVVGLILLIVWLLFIMVAGLLFFYGYLLVNPQAEASGATGQLRDLIQNLWGQVTPYVSKFASLLGPVFVLLFALGILHRLARSGATPFDTSKLLNDLPSALALLIIATICLLPLAGLAIPDVLNNVALVIVGFYFGKRRIADE